MKNIKKALIVTAAGSSLRFSRSLGYGAQKFLYHGDDTEYSLLDFYLNIGKTFDFDSIVIVGGYKYEDLFSFISEHYGGYRKIRLLHNRDYATTGSYFSLYLGINALLKEHYDQIVFSEGDLFFDTASFKRILSSKKSVITATKEEITATNSVIAYIDQAQKIHYAYDQNHKLLTIKEPFSALYNSGQVWKFTDHGLLAYIIQKADRSRFHETNLGIIEPYFQAKKPDEVEIITFMRWFNCNTVEDYRSAIKAMKTALKQD